MWVYDLASKQSAANDPLAGRRAAQRRHGRAVSGALPQPRWQVDHLGLAYIPNNIQRNGKFPAIVYIHGGPTSQSVNSFNRLIQYIVNQGYVVIAPNFRGSTGYGKEFMKANYGDEGGGDLHDIVDAAEWIKKSGFVDPQETGLDGRQLRRLSDHDGGDEIS